MGFSTVDPKSFKARAPQLPARVLTLFECVGSDTVSPEQSVEALSEALRLILDEFEAQRSNCPPQMANAMARRLTTIVEYLRTRDDQHDWFLSGMDAAISVVMLWAHGNEPGLSGTPYVEGLLDRVRILHLSLQHWVSCGVIEQRMSARRARMS
ncbi:protein of unknown function [Aminobacter niigataensis]|nr:protein of unknown function [Aminobacter niigataensis]